MSHDTCALLTFTGSGGGQAPDWPSFLADRWGVTSRLGTAGRLQALVDGAITGGAPTVPTGAAGRVDHALVSILERARGPAAADLLGRVTRARELEDAIDLLGFGAVRTPVWTAPGWRCGRWRPASLGQSPSAAPSVCTRSRARTTSRCSGPPSARDRASMTPCRERVSGVEPWWSVHLRWMRSKARCAAWRAARRRRRARCRAQPWWSQWSAMGSGSLELPGRRVFPPVGREPRRQPDAARNPRNPHRALLPGRRCRSLPGARVAGGQSDRRRAAWEARACPQAVATSSSLVPAPRDEPQRPVRRPPVVAG